MTHLTLEILYLECKKNLSKQPSLEGKHNTFIQHLSSKYDDKPYLSIRYGVQEQGGLSGSGSSG